ncbi:CDP-alcohol phosphatidyltransferase family protein [Candidatus Micrarchaeota archaeon]|nr:CDP-alcohol phosphatidyltransferase family protein [Candidatus Micrarchaeota archaeon]
MQAEKSGRNEERLYPKDLLSLANAVLGLAAIYQAITFETLNAFLLILAAIAFDFADGFIARKSKRGPTKIGRELDSLADVVSFGIAPIVIAFTAPTAIASTSLPELWFSTIILYAASGIYLICALVRLAKFNIQKEAGVYHGLPSPIAAFIVSGTSVLLAESFSLFCQPPSALSTSGVFMNYCIPNAGDYALLIQAFVLAAAGGLMIARFKTRKFW